MFCNKLCEYLWYTDLHNQETHWNHMPLET